MSYYKKKLEGITTNNALLELWKDAYSKNVLQGNKNKNKNKSSDSDSDSNNDNDCKINMIGGPKNEVDAIEVLKKGGDPIKQKKIISIRIIQAIRIIFENENDKKKMELLDNALQQPQQQHAPHASTASKSTKKQKQQQLSLAYTSPPSKESSLESNPEGLTAERRKYLNRIEKLKLQSEETKYSKITTNIKDQRQEDDITAKSMTYAASVGINMIVAPISFGTFMYFFSGGVFDFFFPPNIDDDFNNSSGTKNLNPTGVDIKRVIIGVISGVIMMIIEMLLFVIRTHEFDHYATKKKKKRGVEPFGVYSSKSNKIYTTDNPDISKNNTTSNNNNNKIKSSTDNSKDKKNS